MKERREEEGRGGKGEEGRGKEKEEEGRRKRGGLRWGKGKEEKSGDREWNEERGKLLTLSQQLKWTL